MQLFILKKTIYQVMNLLFFKNNNMEIFLNSVIISNLLSIDTHNSCKGKKASVIFLVYNSLEMKMFENDYVTLDFLL